MAETTHDKVQMLADGLGIPVWITGDGRIVQTRPDVGGTEIHPRPSAKPAPHGAPANTETAGS